MMEISVAVDSEWSKRRDVTHLLSHRWVPIVQHNEGNWRNVLISNEHRFAELSGLAVGDHIIYIGKYNVQKILQFDEKVDTIRKEFNAYREVTLVVLSGAAYRVLKRRGGLLDPLSFDYRATQFPEMKPRLYNLSLYDHEQDFGLALYRENPTFIREIAPGSAADASGIERNDKILEIDGQDTTHLSAKRIQELLKESQLKRKLNILVIDAAGYAYSIKHAIPINSHLPLVRKIPTSSERRDPIRNTVASFPIALLNSSHLLRLANNWRQ